MSRSGIENVAEIVGEATEALLRAEHTRKRLRRAAEILAKLSVEDVPEIADVRDRFDFIQQALSRRVQNARGNYVACVDTLNWYEMGRIARQIFDLDRTVKSLNQTPDKKMM